MLLGIAEVPDPRAQGQPERPRVSLHSAGRDGYSDSARVAGDARIIPVEAGLSNLQRLCHVAVQETRTGFAVDRRDQMETCDASDTIAYGRRQGVKRGLRAGRRWRPARLLAGDQTRRDGLAGGQQITTESSQRF